MEIGTNSVGAQGKEGRENLEEPAENFTYGLDPSRHWESSIEGTRHSMFKECLGVLK